MTKNKITLRILLITTIILFTIISIVNATIDPGDYDPSKKPPTSSDVGKIANIANPIIGTIKVIGIVIAVITLALLGVKYMTGSISEKAEYKKTMIPYLIGAILVVSITQILGVIIEIITEI